MEQTVLAGRFLVQELIGSGGVSSVYRAYDEAKRRSVAIKVLHPHLSRDENARKLIRNEIDLTESIDSPAIIRVFGVHEDSGHFFVSMELLDGGDLRDRILDLGALPVSDALSIARQIAEGLDAAHRLGIIHCDIKPHNILFSSDGSLRISDFGFARSISDTAVHRGDNVPAEASPSPLSGGAGTPDYAAPELMGGGLPDPRADIYSLGVSLFQMLTGRLPFLSSSPQQTLHKHLVSPIPQLQDFRSGLPGELQGLIDRAMAKLPGDRFQTAAEFADALAKGRAAQVPGHSETENCPSCGTLMYRDFPLCVRCGYLEARIAPAMSHSGAKKTTAGTADILIVGPGEAGDRLDLEHRHRLVDYLKRLGSDARRLEKQIPRLPFYLFKGLEAENARELGASLSELGILSRVIRRSNREEKRFARRAIFKKFTALYPRILLVGLGFSGGFWSQIFNAPQFFIPAILGVLLVGAPSYILADFSRGEAKAGGKNQRISSEALARMAADFHQPQARSIIQRIALSLIMLDAMPGQEKKAVEFYNGFLELISQARELDRQLSLMSGVSPEIRGASETTFQRYLDRMLRYSVMIDRYRLGQADVEKEHEGRRALGLPKKEKIGGLI